MIVELGPPEPRESPRLWLLPAGLAALLLLTLGLPSRPAAPVRDGSLALPSPRVVLASRAPAPRDLALPADLARRTARGAGGVTGMPTGAVFETQETWWQYRLTDGRDVRLSRLPPGDSFVAPRATQATNVPVRGGDARAFTTSTSAIVTWTESAATYQLSSRTLSIDELVRLADRLVPD